MVPIGDVDVHGMIIDISTVVVGTITNTLDTGYCQGIVVAPLEILSVCGGIYGRGACPK